MTISPIVISSAVGEEDGVALILCPEWSTIPGIESILESVSDRGEGDGRGVGVPVGAEVAGTGDGEADGRAGIWCPWCWAHTVTVLEIKETNPRINNPWIEDIIRTPYEDVAPPGRNVFVIWLTPNYCFGFSDFMLSCFIFMLQQPEPVE
ncbi:MAG TPA: hypothetical protein VLB68_10025 [Pyrinomonadaceae bacterium]|nr:hypothetical protein [Pyrinomonadaceae bacterium]